MGGNVGIIKNGPKRSKKSSNKRIANIKEFKEIRDIH